MMHPLVYAIEQWHWGEKPDAIALAADNLRLVAPDHWLLQELKQKLARLLGEPIMPTPRTAMQRR